MKIERPRLLARFIRCVEAIALAPPERKLEELSYPERLERFYAAWKLHRANGFAATQEALNHLAAMFSVDAPTLPTSGAARRPAPQKLLEKK